MEGKARRPALPFKTAPAQKASSTTGVHIGVFNVSLRNDLEGMLSEGPQFHIHEFVTNLV